jgi:hypothetical protein
VVVPKEGVGHTDGPAILRSPHQHAFIGIVHELIDRFVAERIDRYDFVVVRLGQLVLLALLVPVRSSSLLRCQALE